MHQLGTNAFASALLTRSPTASRSRSHLVLASVSTAIYVHKFGTGSSCLAGVYLPDIEYLPPIYLSLGSSCLALAQPPTCYPQLVANGLGF